MDTHLYFSLIPEALIASQLTPEQFGQYYATGHGYRSKGQAIFFEVDPTFRNDFFPIEGAFARTVEHEDGSPKNSVYVSAYRVLENIPAGALMDLYLTTTYGATLGIAPSEVCPPRGGGLHLYQELSPVNSLVVSSQDPQTFYEGIVRQPSKLLRFPGVCFVELGIGELETNPAEGSAGDLPYNYINHLREALIDVQQPDKDTKMVHRVHSTEFPYRMVKQGSGFYYGSGRGMAFYPMPSPSELRSLSPLWWRSANQ